MEPADPEAAALTMIVTSAEEATGSSAFRSILQDFAGLLHADGTLAGLSWPDAQRVAAAISFDLVTFDDGAGALERRAAIVAAGRDGMSWADRAAAARAVTAASVLAAW
ncbi:hypothetical protein JCM12141A_40650 [Mycolicibacterium hodleri]